MMEPMQADDVSKNYSEQLQKEYKDTNSKTLDIIARVAALYKTIQERCTTLKKASDRDYPSHQELIQEHESYVGQLKKIEEDLADVNTFWEETYLPYIQSQESGKDKTLQKKPPVHSQYDTENKR